MGAQLRSSLIGGLGDLQALQNLNQLTELNLANCVNLTGQSVSESCSDTTHGDFHSLSVSDRHAPANQRLSSAYASRSLLLSETDRYGFDVGAQPARDFIG